MMMTTLPLHERDTFGNEFEKGMQRHTDSENVCRERGSYRYFSRETVLPSISVAEKLYMEVAVCKSSVGAD